jgi:hypothetical protein
MSTSFEHRQEMVDCCDWAIRHNSQIHYAEIRPIPHLRKYQLPFTTDCSGFVTIMAQWSGNPDPNGKDFDGQGYTGTMMDHLPHIEFHDTLRGDLVVFGGNPGVHVAVLLIGGARESNPPCASHGEPGDPRRYPLADLIDYFREDGAVTYLQLRPND